MIYTMAIALFSYLLGFFLAKWLDGRTQKVDLPKIANEVCLKEGKKHSINIADTKEVLHLFMHEISKLNRKQINYILKNYK